ncbi:MAG: acylphosphatase [Candidatus Aenigmarchaeota archaeon]|nr:acylphosphatase [Candidatus Aenigmarchaeota archaeon]MDW8149429.1 acylphosphatase [Candidatus Aenigmarchaeota archaeon]
MKSYKTLFYGRVQGVGFRATCAKLANRLGIHGYVKNLDDGSVEAVFQCSEDAFFKIIEKLKNIFEIENIEVEEVNLDENFSSFEIR